MYCCMVQQPGVCTYVGARIVDCLLREACELSVHWVVVVHLAVPLGMCSGNDPPYIGCASCFASCDAAAAASPPVWNQHAVTPAVH
jgi:hypothetical protein